MPVTLYRAATRACIAPATFGRGACFADDRVDAEEYTRNRGFGGPALFTYEVEAEFVLRLDRTKTPLTDLAEAIWEDLEEWAEERGLENADDVAQHWGARGLHEVFHVIENDSRVAKALRESYDWIVYREPAIGRFIGTERECVTWRYYGDRPLVGRLAG